MTRLKQAYLYIQPSQRGGEVTDIELTRDLGKLDQEIP